MLANVTPVNCVISAIHPAIHCPYTDDLTVGTGHTNVVNVMHASAAVDIGYDMSDNT